MKNIVTLLFFGLILSQGIAQNVGIGTSSPNASAQLDVTSTNSGFLPPRMTITQRDSILNPAIGLIVFNTISDRLEIFTSTGWVSLTTISANILSANSSPIEYTAGNYATISELMIPGYLNYFGNGSLGNVTATNNMLISNNSMYNNLTIPIGITAKITPSVRTVIYIKDTLFLYGSIDGIGGNANATTSNVTTNQLGASASGYEFWDNQSFASPISVTPNAIVWEGNSVPSTFTENFSGSYQKVMGAGCFNCLGNCNTNANGQNMTTQELKRFVHFGVNISGYNGYAIGNTGSCPFTVYGGQGGAGLYIIAKNVVFEGSLNLSGGNGAFYQCSIKYGRSAAGGGGSCIMRTLKLISNSNGVFNSNGGVIGGGYSCNPKGGNGAMLILLN